MIYPIKKENPVYQRPRSVDLILEDDKIMKLLALCGVNLLTKEAIQITRDEVISFVESVVQGAHAIAQSHKRMGVLLHDILESLKVKGMTMYGYDEICFVGESGYHVTEMVSLQNCLWNKDQSIGDEDSKAYHNRHDFVEEYQKKCVEDSDSESSQDDIDECVSDCSSLSESDVSSFAEVIESITETRVRDCISEDLKYAQDYVDAELGIFENEESIKKQLVSSDDLPIGESPESDSESDLVCQNMINELDLSYNKFGNLIVTELAENDLKKTLCWSEYLFSRKIFIELTRSIFFKSWDVSISKAGISALHNATEDYIFKSLTKGTLRINIQAMVTQELCQLRSQLLDQLHSQSKVSATSSEQYMENKKELEELVQQYSALQEEMNATKSQMSDLMIKIRANEKEAELSQNNINPGSATKKRPRNESVFSSVKDRLSRMTSTKRSKINPVN